MRSTLSTPTAEDRSAPSGNKVQFEPLLVLLVFLYIITRVPLLDRELTYEEPIFIKQGQTFFESGKFLASLGILDPASSGFHKPPLLSLLLASSETIFGHTSASYRLVPFLCALLAFLLTLYVVKLAGGRAWVTAIALITTPFLLAGSNQIQTDGSVGILGFTFVYLLCARCFFEDNVSPLSFIAAGLFLALAKTEIFAMAIPGVLAACLMAKSWRQLIAIIGSYALGGCLGASIIGLISLMTFGNLNGLVEVYGTISGIVGHQISTNVVAAPRGSFLSSSAAVLNSITEWQVILPLLVGLAGAIFIFLRSRTDVQRWRFAVVSVIFSLTPAILYLLVGWNGDGFPRYFLICIPPALAVVGMAASCLNLFWVSAVLCAYLIYYAPGMYHLYQSPGALTGFRGQFGFQDAGSLLRNILPEKSTILAPDPVAFYYGEPYYDISMVEPYPDRWKEFITHGYESLDAWVYFCQRKEDFPASPSQKMLWQKFKDQQKIEKFMRVGSLCLILINNHSHGVEPTRLPTSNPPAIADKLGN